MARGLRLTYLLYFLNFCSEYFDSALLPFVTGRLSRLAMRRLMDALSWQTLEVGHEKVDGRLELADSRGWP